MNYSANYTAEANGTILVNLVDTPEEDMFLNKITYVLLFITLSFTFTFVVCGLLVLVSSTFSTMPNRFTEGSRGRKHLMNPFAVDQ